jgi:hypothetical protein
VSRVWDMDVAGECTPTTQSAGLTT